jgi:hypothetical protein
LELQFVKKIESRCQNFIFAVTKIDREENYQLTVENNRQKLAQVLERSEESLTIIPVSSYLKEVYLESQVPEDLEDSNFPILEKELWQFLNQQRGYILILRALNKLGQYVSEIKQVYYSERANNNGSVSKQVAEIAAIVDKIEAKEHALRELNVLQDYEAGKLDFNHDELEQLLEVTGEKGTSLNKRLGLAEDVAIAQLLARVHKRINYWIIRSNDPLGSNFYTIGSAQILLQFYERLKFQIEQANVHLEIYSNSRLN